MKVSVLVPAYNAAETLGGALSALVSQTRAPDEILLCDDGSTDATAEVAGGFPDVRVLQRSNGGVSAARNTLLDEARGDIVMFCDADDRPHSDWIERLAGQLEAEDADLAVAGVCAGPTLDERRYVYPCTEACVLDGTTFYRHMLAHPKGCYGYLHCAAMRREVLERAPRLRFAPALQLQEDEVYLLGLARRVTRVACVPDALYDYLYRPGSACDRYFRGAANARLRYQFFLRDREKFRISGRPGFALKALRSWLRARVRQVFRGEEIR